mmetsp:Transcript_26676/g.25705  ORF Transcript_26676/g.25705 Transcript_26676/m.25705 type:complete len:97 (+) Transcript_26676:340-630(+)
MKRQMQEKEDELTKVMEENKKMKEINKDLLEQLQQYFSYNLGSGDEGEGKSTLRQSRELEQEMVKNSNFSSTKKDVKINKVTYTSQHDMMKIHSLY